MLVPFLIALALLTSCDMSRWYFRHGGTSAVAKNEVVTEQEMAHKSSSQTIVDSDHIRDTLTTKAVPELIDVDQQEEVFANGSTDAIQQEDLSQKNDVEQIIRKKNSRQQAASQSRQHINAGAYLWLLLLILLVLLIFIGLLTFLISWIFVPVAIALRIMLWTLMGVLALLLLLSICILLFS